MLPHFEPESFDDWLSRQGVVNEYESAICLEMQLKDLKKEKEWRKIVYWNIDSSELFVKSSYGLPLSKFPERTNGFCMIQKATVNVSGWYLNKHFKIDCCCYFSSIFLSITELFRQSKPDVKRRNVSIWRWWFRSLNNCLYNDRNSIKFGKFSFKSTWFAFVRPTFESVTPYS